MKGITYQRESSAAWYRALEGIGREWLLAEAADGMRRLKALHSGESSAIGLAIVRCPCHANSRAASPATVPLEPEAPNMMVGKLQAPLGSKARVVFSANLHGHSLTARYVTE
jgi:hypothetical protein